MWYHLLQFVRFVHSSADLHLKWIERLERESKDQRERDTLSRQRGYSNLSLYVHKSEREPSFQTDQASKGREGEKKVREDRERRERVRTTWKGESSQSECSLHFRSRVSREKRTAEGVWKSEREEKKRERKGVD